MNISQAAEKTGLSAKQIRDYEKQDFCRRQVAPKRGIDSTMLLI